jgi:hypothetical protein
MRAISMGMALLMLSIALGGFVYAIVVLDYAAMALTAITTGCAGGLVYLNAKSA